MAKFEIATILSQHKLMQVQLSELTGQLVELAKQMTDYEYLASVPGIGDVTIVDLLSEVGSLTQYVHPRQLIKLAGLTLMPLILHNPAFKQLHEYYTTRTNNPLRKKQSIVVLCGKLLKILHALCKKKTIFNEQQMMIDFAHLQTAVTN